jgi:tRNA(Ile)-lysidine synthase TilS/MesJ
MIRDGLNSYAQSHPGVKERILKRFLKAKEGMQQEILHIKTCERCGEPSSKTVCNACLQIAVLQKI